MFAERDKHYPSRSGQTSLATAVTNITKPVTKINFGPSIILLKLWYNYWAHIPLLRQVCTTQFEKRALLFQLTRMVPKLKKNAAFYLLGIWEYFSAPICHEIWKTICISRLKNEVHFHNNCNHPESIRFPETLFQAIMGCVGTRIMIKIITLPCLGMKVWAEQMHLASPLKNKISSYATRGCFARNSHTSSCFKNTMTR